MRLTLVFPLIIACATVDAEEKPLPSQMDLATVHTRPVASPLPLRPMHVRDGTLLYDDGGEVALWGVNYQPCLSWEYNDTLVHSGVALTPAGLKKVIDQDLPQLKIMRTEIIRVHLVPTDFTDARGNLVETPFLDALDYLLFRCDKEGIYVYLTLVNAMGKPFLPQSFLSRFERSQWLFDDHCVALTRHYVKTLLGRTNPYSIRRYAREPALAVLEIINEPSYPDWKEISSDPRLAALKVEYQAALAAAHSPDTEQSFSHFRGSIISKYLSELVADIRSTGAQQPIAWNLTWPGSVWDHGDVFDAVAASPIDAISFSVYPGEADLPSDYWKHPTDLSKKNFLPYLQHLRDDYWQLGCILGQRLVGKAKLVYEFEGFYNQSMYLYPEMARLFRALGAQTATMWRYIPAVAAGRLTASGASHFLNLAATPRKAISAMIAADLFSSVPRYTSYQHEQWDEDRFGPFSTSFPGDFSVECSADRLLYSGTVHWNTLSIGDRVKEIAGLGNSPLVSYDGTGAYVIDISQRTIAVHVLPDVITGAPAYIGGVDGTYRICKLDFTTVHRLQLNLPGWNDSCTVWRLTPTGRQRLPKPSRLAIHVAAGDYEIEEP